MIGERKTLAWLMPSVLSLSMAAWSPTATRAEPAVTRAQLEADWLRQLELRYPRVAASRGNVTKEEDAAGAVDGVKDGKWGFHTENEEQPWWQVDLGQVAALDRLVLYNRCDGGFGQRAARIQVLLSVDGQQFRKVYQHDGTAFLGQTDNKPLSVPLAGNQARYVRLQLPGRSYFHLDEVEIYSPDGGADIALHKPATQSSTSQWSACHASGQSPALAPVVVEVVQQGLQLAAELQRRGVNTASQAAALQAIRTQAERALRQADPAEARRWYFQTQEQIRALSLQNPLLNFDAILFVKRAPTLFPHVSDQHYGWWSRPGGGIYLLTGLRSGEPQVQCLTQAWPAGNFIGPDLSYDGRKVLFAWCRHYPELAHVADKTDKDQLPEDSFYHVFEMRVDGSGVRQLTHGRYDDFEARYLPNGRIVLLSTRKGTALQAGKRSAAATVDRAGEDSYVRCGGGNHRPVAVFTLHTIDADGGDWCAISAFENFEWTPAVAHDGRVLYARWDYIDRFNGPFFSLWSTNPDGTNSQLVYGNYTVRPQCVFQARPIPGSHRLIFTATAHHSITGGSLALLDRTRGTEFERPLTRLTPEVCFPETEGWPQSYYVDPWPLSEQYFLAAWSDRPLPPHSLMKPDDRRNPPNACGIYLYDAFGNLTLLHRDPAISSVAPIPLTPRTPPPVVPDAVDWAGAQEGQFLVQDVYQGLDGVPRGAIRRLRIVGVPPKVQPQMNSPAIGVSKEDPGKYVLGTVPVEDDGSAWFRLPSGVSVFFQALDADGLAVQTMRSLTYVQPGQTLACVGCHEYRGMAPPPAGSPLALLREPSRLTPEPDGCWPLRFDQLVQPVLDRHCVSCHEPGVESQAAAAFDLTPAVAWQTLVEYADGDLRKLAFERDQSFAGQTPARNSKLYRLLTAEPGHYQVRLPDEDRRRLAVWMDTYAQRLGSFSEAQERQLGEFREDFSALLAK
ncbi:MAG: hypothetical protein GX575_07130 [Candidatus Anammoximicrobium sp.]|nr:hypothetical protein [Candidatus Anammoximicrobium sp.]